MLVVMAVSQYNTRKTGVVGRCEITVQNNCVVHYNHTGYIPQFGALSVVLGSNYGLVTDLFAVIMRDNYHCVCVVHLSEFVMWVAAFRGIAIGRILKVDFCRQNEECGILFICKNAQ